MEENNIPNNTNSSDEIDLGQLFQMIGKGFNRIFRSFLRMFLYLKKNALILFGLVILGGAIGFGLNQIVDNKMKTEVIVKPNLESKNYLYDVVDEIQANIKAKDTSFFKNLGVNIEHLEGFEISIEQVGDKNNVDIEYLELLEKFQNSGVVSDVVRSEILNKSSLNHRITFLYKDALKGQVYAKKLMDYINSNDYFNGMVKIYIENANERIKKNEILLGQIDDLIDKYSKKIAETDRPSGDGRIVLDNEEKMDITGLFEIKNDLIRDIESKKLELKKRSEAISGINFGKPQQVQKDFFGKNIVMIPLVFVGLFFLVSFLKYLNKKSGEILG